MADRRDALEDPPPASRDAPGDPVVARGVRAAWWIAVVSVAFFVAVVFVATTATSSNSLDASVVESVPGVATSPLPRPNSIGEILLAGGQQSAARAEPESQANASPSSPAAPLSTPPRESPATQPSVPEPEPAVTNPSPAPQLEPAAPSVAPRSVETADFPIGHPSFVSRLVRAAKSEGFLRGHAAYASKKGYCPPFNGKKALLTPEAIEAALAGISIGLVVVSYDAPATLRNSMDSWAKSGFLDLVDEKVAFLNAPIPMEKELMSKAGFKVLTPEPEQFAALRKKHDTTYFNITTSYFNWPNLHFTADKRPSLYIGPSLMYALAESSADVIVFLEKDFMIPAVCDRACLVRQLLYGVSLLNEGTDVVRLRRFDDLDRAGLPDCCAGKCGSGVNGFSRPRDWTSHLNWLYLFCDRERIEQRSRGNVAQCTGPAWTQSKRGVSDRFTEAEDPTAWCFTAEHSGWSNNANMFRRKWFRYDTTMWTAARASARESNGHFELNAMGWWNFKPVPRICQLGPAIFHHKEIDKRRA